MRWRLGTWAGIVFVCVLTGCYTDRINVAPTVSIVPPTRVSRGAAAQFGAFAQDDHAAVLKYQWSVTAGACPDGGALPTTAPLGAGSDSTFSVTLGASGDYCASVVVTDDQGASSHATYSFHIDDQPPTPSIAAIDALMAARMPAASVPLYSNLHFSGRGSSDPDPGDTLALSWSLTPPAGAAGRPPACPAPSGDDTCFTVDQPGSYQLTLTVTDSDGMVAKQTFSFEVAPDQPPCIVETDPPFAAQGAIHDPKKPLTFTVTRVADDGDPLPAPADRSSTLSFVWSWRVDPSAAFTRMVDVDLPQFPFPADSLQSGRTLQVRVEAHDRIARSNQFLSCAQAQPQPAGVRGHRRL